MKTDGRNHPSSFQCGNYETENRKQTKIQCKYMQILISTCKYMQYKKWINRLKISRKLSRKISRKQNAQYIHKDIHNIQKRIQNAESSFVFRLFSNENRRSQPSLQCGNYEIENRKCKYICINACNTKMHNVQKDIQKAECTISIFCNFRTLSFHACMACYGTARAGRNA